VILTKALAIFKALGLKILSGKQYILRDPQHCVDAEVQVGDEIVSHVVPLDCKHRIRRIRLFRTFVDWSRRPALESAE
jgi:hypothetical protein